MKSDTEKEISTALLKKYGNFFKTQLQDLVSLSRCEMWDENKSFLPIQLVLAPTEAVPIIELVSSDNTLMTKVLGVLSSLCIEIIQLKQEAFERFV